MLFKNVRDLKDEDLETLLSRQVDVQDVVPQVSEILADIAANGDAAVLRYTQKFDGVAVDNIRVTQDEIDYAYSAVDDVLVAALTQAAENIAAFHERQMERDIWFTEILPGVMAGQKTVPIDSVGAYVPGGRASYPSSALMSVIPAKVAGVPRVVVCSPPGPDCKIPPATIVASDLAGADEIYKIGGVQAIAALGLGTGTVEKVAKIVGPGNIYVTAAKMLIRGAVEIDFPAGPSEVLIIADRSANPTVLAADMIAQGEHDPLSVSVLVTTDEMVANAVFEELQIQCERASRKEIIKQSMEHMAVLVAKDIEEALDLSNAFAPEHLEIVVKDSLSALQGVKHAGSVFLGPYTPVAAGDYASGTNHVLPTSGFAKAFSGLNVDHFTKKFTVQMISREGLEMIEDCITTLAEAEGLQAHAQSVKIRLS